MNGCSAACGCGTDSKRKKAAVYETRPIMPRAGARAGETGDAGGAAGSKVRSIEAKPTPENSPANKGLAVALRRALQHRHIFLQLAPAAKKTRRGPPAALPGQSCDGMLGAMVRIAPTGPRRRGF